MNYPLASLTWAQDELDAAKAVLDSGNITMGRAVENFERQFADYFGVPYAVMVNSGSSANLIAVAALFYKKDNPLRRGDEVIVPAIAWATTYAPLQQYGLRLRFVDVDRDTLNADPISVLRAISPKTRLVLGVSVLGNPGPLKELREICEERNCYFLEDNCESIGAKLDGKLTGTFGDIGTFSFFFSHHLSTGEGGIAITENEELFHLMRALRSHGWTRNLPSPSPLFAPEPNDFESPYRFLVPGYNLRPLEIAGAVGSIQLKKLQASIAIRRRNAEYFQSLFGDDERFIFQRENGQSSWFSFTFIVRPEWDISRRRIIDKLMEAGIECRMITGGNFLRHDVIRHFDYEVMGETPNADLAHDFGFFVGNQPQDLSKEIRHLYSVLKDIS